MRKRCLAAAAFVAAAGFSGAAEARCVLPILVQRDADEAAEYVLASEALVIDGIVRELPRGDGTLFQRIEVIRYLKGKGADSIDIWPGPRKPTRHDILNTDDWGRIDAPAGSRVVTALRQTPYGWTVGECAYQALAVPGVEGALREMTAARGKTEKPKKK
ncbi:hypothetical protein [Sphingosinicella soli]|uniref:Uncharacterized protein n=1 Tax=Sphingosinicella soli TaxID=333708 RepID=A0A7W7B1U2_9SPHN|nr:hypothetical protein [Sphingosinicella soli]MBB4632446.1 hypothetical protein [Sphingosinicella soli]